MPHPRQRLTASAAQSDLADSLAALRESLGVPDGFPDEVLAEASQATEKELGGDLDDLRDLEFCTVDPPGAQDLDQALHLSRDGDTQRLIVHYAIADVPWFVVPGGAVDHEARRRGQTLYAPDRRAPLHPEVLSEGAASLLPDQDRRAFVWQFTLDDRYDVAEATLRRATVRSRRQWTYEEAQAAVDDGSAPPSLALLLPFGLGRQALESARGGASLNRPEGEVVLTDQGYTIERRSPLPIEEANAQLSLMTGMAAAKIMIDGGIGILRTMPAAEPDAIDRFRRQTEAIGIPWPEQQAYGDYLRDLDRDRPEALAVLQAATSLFRGAGYAAFDGAAPDQPIQAALAAPYAHVTAPLRRLVDRFVLATCAALTGDQPVPDWTRQALPELPAIMDVSDDLAGQLDAGVINRVEAALLHSRVGQTFEALVLSRSAQRRRIQLTDPFVTASVADVGEPGDRIRVKLTAADIAAGEISFEPA